MDFLSEIFKDKMFLYPHIICYQRTKSIVTNICNLPLTFANSLPLPTISCHILSTIYPTFHNLNVPYILRRKNFSYAHSKL